MSSETPSTKEPFTRNMWTDEIPCGYCGTTDVGTHQPFCPKTPLEGRISKKERVYIYSIYVGSESAPESNVYLAQSEELLSIHDVEQWFLNTTDADEANEVDDDGDPISGTKSDDAVIFIEVEALTDIAIVTVV